MKKTGIEDIDSYCEGVSSGEINVCGWVQKAVERHYKDLEKSEDPDYPYEFVGEAALDFFRFCENWLRHYEGVFAGKPLILRPWQKFVYGSMFGWLKKKEHRNPAYDHIPIRKFRDGIVIVPKKNGKSILSAAVALYMMDGDDWPAAQCYILAKNQTHAKDLGYRAAVKMTQASNELSEDYRINRSAADAGIYYDANNSFYKPITSKPESEDGRNVHFCGPDETKDWTDFDIYDVMKNGTVNAPNSLFMSTTTAGHNRDSLGFQQQEYLEKVLNGIIEDEATFGVIYSIDKEDKEEEGWWADPAIWKKANPNYGVSVFEDALKSMIPAARQSLNKRIAFETKHLNIWHSSSEAFIPDETWASCGKLDRAVWMDDIMKSLKPYKGLRAWGGLDLGSVSDFTSFKLIIEPEDEIWRVLSFFWIPADTIPDRRNSSMVREWVNQGYIGATTGNVMDHNITREAILKIAEMVNIQEIAYDRYKMTEMVNNLMEQGLEMTPFGQGYVSMAPAVDNLETLILQEEIEHFGNPVLAWMNSNVTIRKDPARNRKFDKEKSQDKIDGMVALAMGLSRACYGETESQITEWDEVKFV